MNIWVDMDNAPHVLVLYPLIKELSARGHHSFITAKDYGQTIELLRLYGLEHRVIGKHAGKNKLLKVTATLARSMACFAYTITKDVDIALCHGSRSMFLAAKARGIPLVALSDYEHTYAPTMLVNWAIRLIMPDAIELEGVVKKGVKTEKIFRYPGYKEELYVYSFEPDAGILQEIGADERKIIVVVRPPATMAHYHVSESEELFWESLHFLLSHEAVQIVLIPRTSAQRRELRTQISRLDKKARVLIPQKVFFGPNLIFNSDLVISGGGTMNREAACMGVPVYSIFRGPLGGVDKKLSDEGKLTLIKNSDMVRDILLCKRIKKPLHAKRGREKLLVNCIVDEILAVADVL